MNKENMHFTPYYKGNNSVIKWFCELFGLGKYSWHEPKEYKKYNLPKNYESRVIGKIDNDEATKHYLERMDQQEIKPFTPIIDVQPELLFQWRKEANAMRHYYNNNYRRMHHVPMHRYMQRGKYE